jgi:hypothetical protein
LIERLGAESAEEKKYFQCRCDRKTRAIDLNFHGRNGLALFFSHFSSAASYVFLADAGFARGKLPSATAFTT